MSHESPYRSMAEFNTYIERHKLRVNTSTPQPKLLSRTGIAMNTLSHSLSILQQHIDDKLHNNIVSGNINFSIRDSVGADMGGVAREVYTTTMYQLNTLTDDNLYLNASHPSKSLPHILKLLKVDTALDNIRRKNSIIYHALHLYGLRGFITNITITDIITKVPAVLIPDELYRFISGAVLELPALHEEYLLNIDANGRKMLLIIWSNILENAGYLAEFKAAYAVNRGDMYFGTSIYKHIAGVLGLTHSHLAHLFMVDEDGKNKLWRLYERISREPHILDEFKAAYSTTGGIEHFGAEGIPPRTGGRRRKTKKGRHFKRTIKRRGKYKRTRRMAGGSGSEEFEDEDEMSVLDILDSYKYKGIYDLDAMYDLIRTYIPYRVGYTGEDPPNILDLYYLMNPDNTVSNEDIEFLISHLSVDSRLTPEVVEYMKGLIRNYTTGLTPEMAAALQERFPTHSDFMKELLRYWSGVEFVNRLYVQSGNKYKLTQENSYYEEEQYQYLFNAHTCFYQIGINMNIFSTLATPDERMTVILGSLGTGMNQAGGFFSGNNIWN
jgi:hypothetical protein